MADRPKIAGIVTEYRKYSHAQHICDRFLKFCPEFSGLFEVPASNKESSCSNYQALCL